MHKLLELNLCELITTVGAVLGGLIAIVKYIKDRNREKRKSTIEAYAQLQKDVFDKLYLEFKNSEIEEIVKHPKINSDKYHLLGIYAAKIEHFCVGVMNDTYDWETTYKLSHGFLDGTIKRKLSPLYERKLKYTTYDPYANTKCVIEKLERYAEKKNEFLKGE